MTPSARRKGVRHRLADRIFHWGMAIAVLVLGATAFLPILGARFDWVPVHWISGIVLVLLVLYHLARVFLIQGIGEMIPGPADLQEIGRVARDLGTEDLPDAKYDAFQKGFHWAAAVSILLLIATGLLMLAKIDTTFWRRNPAILSDQDWGIIYVLHGASALVLLFLVILHVYFAVLPEHRSFLLAMINGKGPESARGESKA